MHAEKQRQDLPDEKHTKEDDILVVLEISWIMINARHQDPLTTFQLKLLANPPSTSRYLSKRPKNNNKL